MFFKSFHLLLLAGLLSLNGCAYLGNWMHNGFKVGPDYQTPAAATAEQWIEFDDPHIISQANNIDEAAWWQNFNDPVLNKLVLAAQQQNLPLHIASLRVLEARSQRAIVAGNLFPQSQQAIGGYEYRERSLNGFTNGLPSGVHSMGPWTAGFTASWELDLWGRLRRAIESADAKLDASIFHYDDVLVTLVADIASTYVEIRAYQERLQYAETNIAIQEASFRLAEERVKSGVANKLDVTQAQATLHQTKAQRSVLQRGLWEASNNLCVLLGMPPRDLADELHSDAQPSVPTAPDQVIVGIPADLIRRRPDVRSAEREIASQSALIGVAAADLFPMFSITGNLQWQATNFNDLFTPAANCGMISPSFNWKILNYGRIVNNVKVQEARFQQAVAAYSQTVLEANRDTETGIVAFLRSRDRVEELRQTVAAAEESMAMTQVLYKGGWIDFDRLNNIQRDLAVQQDALVAAQADIALSLIRVYRALGGGWQQQGQ